MSVAFSVIVSAPSTLEVSVRLASAASTCATVPVTLSLVEFSPPTVAPLAVTAKRPLASARVTVTVWPDGRALASPTDTPAMALV